MKPKYIDYFNQLLADCMSEEQAVEQYEYLAKPATIRNHHRNHILGNLIRKKDPIAYQVGKKEWETEQRSRINRAK